LLMKTGNQKPLNYFINWIKIGVYLIIKNVITMT
jgi:hypothetical protein